MIQKLIYGIGLIIISTQILGCSGKTNASGKLATDVATVGIQVKGALRKMRVNELVVLPISIRNNGVATIPSAGGSDGSFIVLVTYHWYREGGSLVVWDGVRTRLPEDIRKDKSIDVSLSLKAPSEPGKYTLVVDLVQEGALWFADTGSQTAVLTCIIEN